MGMGKVIKGSFGPRITEATLKMYRQAAEEVGTPTLSARPDGPKGAPKETQKETWAWAALLALATQRPGRPKPGSVQPWPASSVAVDRGCGAIFAAPAPHQKRR